MTIEVRVRKTWFARSPQFMCPFTENIVKKMTGNTDFPNPPVTLSALTTACTRTLLAYGNRKNGAFARKELENASAEQNSMLLLVANYVSNNAFNDAAKILSTGFTVTKTKPTKAVVPMTPAAPKLKCVNGNLVVRTPKVAGATNYCWIVYLGEVQPITVSNTQVNIDTLTNTILIPGGSTREIITGIPAGTKVHVQVFAQNSAGRSALSTAVSTYVIC